MACRVCKKLKLKTVRALNEEFLGGDASLSTLSTKYNVPLKYLNRHVKKCLAGGPKSGHAVLQDLLNKVIKDLEDARQDYKYGDAEDSKGAAFFYSSLLREARELVVSQEKLQPNDEIVEKINRQIMVPFQNEMARVLLEEGSGLKSELQVLLGSSYDKKTEAAVKEAWKRIAIRFKMEAGKIHPKLLELFPQDGQKSKPSSKELPSTSPAKTTHQIH